MLSRDLPYLIGAHWRNPSFLLWDGNEDLYEDWLIKLKNAPEWTLFVLTYTSKGNTPRASDAFQPIMKTCDMFRSLGPGRRFSLQEILEQDDLTDIEFVRSRF